MASVLLLRRLHLSSSSFVSHYLQLCVWSSLTPFNVPRLPHPNSRFFSASSKAEMEEAERVSANERLKHVLKTRINSWPETFSLPKDCPFEIVPQTYHPDNCDGYIYYARFKRKFYGEEIEVTVTVNDFDLDCEDEEEEKGDDDKDGENKDVHPSSELSIKIDKGNGICLEYSCFTYLKEFTVHKMHLKSYQIKEDGNDSKEKRYYTSIGKLDAETAEAAKQCLEARGIDGSLVKLAEQYVLSKNLQHRNWLNKFEKFATV